MVPESIGLRPWIFWKRNIRINIYICTLDIVDDVADLVWIPYVPESNSPKPTRGTGVSFADQCPTKTDDKMSCCPPWAATRCPLCMSISTVLRRHPDGCCRGAVYTLRFYSVVLRLVFIEVSGSIHPVMQMAIRQGSQVVLNLTFSFRCILYWVLPNLTDFVPRHMFSEFPSKISSSLVNHLCGVCWGIWHLSFVNPDRTSLRMARISLNFRRHLVHLCVRLKNSY